MSNFECFLLAWQSVDLFNPMNVTFYNFIVYFLPFLLLSLCDFSWNILKVLYSPCHFTYELYFPSEAGASDAPPTLQISLWFVEHIPQLQPKLLLTVHTCHLLRRTFLGHL